MKLTDFLPKIQTIYGKEGEHETPYLTRFIWGRLRIHKFHRGDDDPDCHDHPWDFWTFPLVGYYEEEIYTVPEGKTRYYRHREYQAGESFVTGPQRVEAFKWHHRKAEHRHRVLYPIRTKDGGYTSSYTESAKSKYAKWPIWTIVWTGPERRDWKFWLFKQVEDELFSKERKKYAGLFSVPWREYVYGNASREALVEHYGPKQEEAQQEAAEGVG